MWTSLGRKKIENSESKKKKDLFVFFFLSLSSRAAVLRQVKRQSTPLEIFSRASLGAAVDFEGHLDDEKA